MSAIVSPRSFIGRLPISSIAERAPNPRTGVTSPAARMRPERHVAVHSRNAIGNLPEIHPVGGEPVETQVDPHLAGLHAVQLHPRDSGDAPYGVGDPAFEAVVTGRQIHAGSGDPRLDDRNLRRREGVDIDLPYVAREVPARVLNGLEDLGARHVHRFAPGELELQVRTVGGRLRADPPDAGNRGERFLERLDDLALDLAGARVLIRNGHEDAREVHVREVGERDPREGDAAEHEHAEQHHRRGDRAIHRQAGKTHTALPGTLPVLPVGVFRPAPLPVRAAKLPIPSRRMTRITPQTASGRIPRMPSGSPRASTASKRAARRSR